MAKDGLAEKSRPEKPLPIAEETVLIGCLSEQLSGQRLASW